MKARWWKMLRARRATDADEPSSHQLRRRIMNQPKIDPADQAGAERLGGADSRIGLSQRRDVRSKRHDATEHKSNRSESGHLAGSKQAKNHDEQQGGTAGNRDPGRQN